MSSQPTSIEALKGLSVTVMGLGMNGGGIPTARFLARAGARVTVTDMKGEAELAPSVEALAGLPIRFVLGGHDMDDFSSADIVIKNPAVKPDSPFLLAAKAVETDISLFLRFSKAPIVAVTGSKGKSSTATAIRHCLSACGYTSFLGGNITRSPLDFIDETDAFSPVVLELSSWQLGDLKGMGLLRPRVAVLTAIMPDHLNRYAGMDDYVADKRLVYADQGPGDWTICRSDEAYGRSFASETPGSPALYGPDLPESAPTGAWLESEEGWARRNGGIPVPILPPRLLVPGFHQRINMLGAALAAYLYGGDPAIIRKAIGEFGGVEHRLERFLVKDGVAYVNDSAATIPQAVAAALDALEGPIVLITGGSDKNLDFSPVASSYGKATHIVLLAGSGTEKLRSELDGRGIVYTGPFSDFSAALDSAISEAEPGGCVLLSPGCTSFGMFLNEFDRGNRFKELVRAKTRG